MVLSESQERVLAAISAAGSMRTAANIGWDITPKMKGIAVTSTLRALERRGLVHRDAPRDQWSCAYWGITDAGRELVGVFTK